MGEICYHVQVSFSRLTGLESFPVLGHEKTRVYLAHGELVERQLCEKKKVIAVCELQGSRTSKWVDGVRLLLHLRWEERGCQASSSLGLARFCG